MKNRKTIITLMTGLLVSAFVLGFSSPAFAAVPDPSGPVVIISPTSLNWVTVLQLFVIPVLLPALVGLVDRLTDLAAFWKRLLLFVLALLSQVLNELIESATTGTGYDIWLALFLGLVAYAVAELTYQKAYKLPVKKPTSRTAAPRTLAKVIQGK